MSTFRVIVAEADDPDVPGTGAFTAGGFGSMGGVWAGVLIAVLAIGAVITMTILRKRRVYNYDGRKGGFGIGSKGKKIGGLFSILLIMTALVVPLAAGGKNAERVFAGGGETDLAITVRDVELSLKKITDGTVNGQYATNVIINSSTPAGYKLSLYASTADLLPANSSTQTRFSGLSGTSLTTLSANCWGVSLTASPNKDDSVWYGVPTTKDSALVLANKTSTTSAGDSTDIVYGVVVGSDMTPDTYSTTINYVATAYVVTNEP